MVRWKRGGRPSEHVEDRRGAGPAAGGGGFPFQLPNLPMGGKGCAGVGGGAVSLLIVLALTVFGGTDIFGGGGSSTFPIDPSIDLPASPGGGEGIDPGQDELADFVSFVHDDVQAMWDEQFQRADEEYPEATLVLFTGAVDSGCGFAQSALGPFYCPLDSKAYVDLDFFRELEARFGASGDFAVAYVIAHELGHHVQNVLGIDEKVRREAQEDPDETNELSVRQELQADCFAGIWGHSTFEREILESGDLEEGLDAAAAVGDDRLQEQHDAGLRKRGPDGLDPGEALRAIREQVHALVERQTLAFTKDIAPALEQHGVQFPDYAELGGEDRAELARVFEERVYPVLTPLAVDPAHPFPYISNLSLNLAVVVRNPQSGEERFARVKVPPALPRFIPLPGSERFVALEQLIAAHLDRLFPGMAVLTCHPFRVTRDADFELDDEDEDLLEAIESVLHRRTKFGHTVRLEVDTTMTDELLDVLVRELGVPPGGVVSVDGPLDLSGLWDVVALDRPDLEDEPWAPQTQAALVRPDDLPVDLFQVLRSGDVLVHHPYDSFATSVEAFVRQAANDPQVLAIKQTIYRTAGPESAIVRSLATAAREGKQVVALVELKARFDEEANIERARVLEEAGVHVVYGLVGLKTHAKILLVVRQEDDGIRRYCHFGTGNYNPVTATLYEDLGVLTADADMGQDLTELFNHLTGYSRPARYRRLIVAPEELRNALSERIRTEAAKGPAGRITLKMNSLVDSALIDDLYDASAAGTPVDLIVRGICCLRPQVPGLSEHIRVRSIVGRYLEHSRIYRFGAGDDAEYLIGSADWMPRNLDRRVEALCDVRGADLKARLAEIFDVELADDVLAWELRGDGTWHRVETVAGLESHVRFRELATERARPRG